MKKRGRKRNSVSSSSVENKEQFSEDWCFICKDGGLLLVCDFKDCLKAYHPECVEKDSSFLETGERWTCSCHSCFLCRKSPKFYCYCCPNSVCKRCISVAEFVHVRRNNGFCNNCLKLALLIEENVDIDSDGGKIDFEDRDTYEFLFKGYWDIIKEAERLTLEDLHSADILLKKGESFKSESDSEGEELDEQLISNFDDMDDVMEDGTLSFMEYKGKQHATGKMLNSKVKSKKMEFIGWGSRPLIDFLGTIGKDPSKPFTQYEVHDIIMEYIRQYKLNDPERKKKIIFDTRLRTVFGKKSTNRNKIYDLLEPHFAANQEESEGDELGYNSEEEEGTQKTCKRQKRMSSDRALEKEKVSEAPRSCFASVTTANIKLVYLKRSLVEDFSRTPETFEERVKGSFVRIKTDPNDYLQRNSHQLVQVIGVKNTLETSNTCKDIILQVSNIHKDVHIWMLSDDDFSEEECDDLHQRVKDGLLKRPTIWEFEQKAKILHEDITYHWIERELVLLQNLIDRANEKGWRRELCEYLEKQQLLQSPSERLRLMQEVPKVTADEIELEATTLDLPKDENFRGDDSPRSILAKAAHTVEDLTGKGTPSDPKVGRLNPSGSPVIGDAVTLNASPGIAISNSAEEEVGTAEAVKGTAEKDAKAISEEAQWHFDVAVPQNQRKQSDTFVSEHKSDALVVEEQAQTSDACTTKENKEISDVIVSTKQQSNLTAPAEDQHQLNSINVSEEQHLPMEVEEQGSKEKLSLNSTNGDQKKVEKGNVSAVEVIELDDEEDEDQGPGDAPGILGLEDPESESWHYVDPFGDVQGPFSMMLLKKWSESNYFQSDFRVWKTGQSQESAILLIDALSQIFSKNSNNCE